MVLQFLLCLVFLKCGGIIATTDLEGDKMKNLEDKANLLFPYKSVNDRMKDWEGDKMKNLEDKSNLLFSYKSENERKKDREGNKIKSLEDKSNILFSYKSANDRIKVWEGDKMKNLEDKSNLLFSYKSANDRMKDWEGDKMKNLEDKSNLLFSYKSANDRMKDWKGDKMKNLEDKSNLLFSYKSKNGRRKDWEGKKVKSLEDKSNLLFSYRSVNDKIKDQEGIESKDSYQKTESNEMKGLGRKDDNMEHYDNNYDERVEIGLFTLDELRGFSVGKKLPMFFPIRDHSLYPPFLPKEVADAIPFSSSQVSNILHLFSVSQDSPEGTVVQDTLQKCELEAADGWTRLCVTSLESLYGFLSKVFGPEVDFKLLSTRHPTMTTPIFQNYTVLGSPREIESPKKVACHQMPYVYAVYFCHFDAIGIRTFKLQLVGDSTGDEVDALVVCHMDTSGWSFDHAVFRVFGMKHGDALCHVFFEASLVWINQPSAIVVSDA